MVQKEESRKSSPFIDNAFDISIEVVNQEDLPIREKGRSTSHVSRLSHKVFFSLFSLIASESLKDNYTNSIDDVFGNIIDLLFRRFNLDHLDDKGSLEDSIKGYLQGLGEYLYFLPSDLVELVKFESGLTSLEFDIGYEGDLDSVMECIREILKSLRDEKIEFWKKVLEKYKEDKEAYDLEFRTKQTRRQSDLDKFSKIDIDEHIKKLGSIGKRNYNKDQ